MSDPCMKKRRVGGGGGRESEPKSPACQKQRTWVQPVLSCTWKSINRCQLYSSRTLGHSLTCALTHLHTQRRSLTFSPPPRRFCRAFLERVRCPGYLTTKANSSPFRPKDQQKSPAFLRVASRPWKACSSRLKARHSFRVCTLSKPYEK